MKKQERKRIHVRTLWFFLLVHLIFFSGVAQSDFPESPITLIAAMAVGGPTDLSARAIAIGASSYLKQSIVVDNKAGGGGTIALSVTTTAKPDGYTLACSPSDPIIITPMMQKVPFKPLKSFTPILAYASPQHTALLVKSDAPWKTFKEFIEYAKKNPGKVKYSSAGIGQSMHIAMEVIAQQDGISWVHVPFKGTVPAKTALLGGHVDACSSGVDWPPSVQSGELRALATHGETRSPHTPNVPTLKELGYDFVNRTVHSIVGPAGLPPDVVKKLETAFRRGTETPEFKGMIEKLYMTPVLYGSEEYDRYLKEYWARSEKMLKDTHIIKESATQPY